MKPEFRILANGSDITDLINDRLLLLRTTDKAGLESDGFELRLDDRDDAIALPERGAEIEVFLGYDGKLEKMGRYTVDEVAASGPPATLVISGKAADMRGSGKTVRNGAFEDTTLAEVVKRVAARNGWEPVCTLTDRVVRLEQRGESDINFITRVAKLYDCTAKVADGKLLVMRREGSVSASGRAIDPLVIRRSDLSRWQFRFSDRSAQKSVRTRYQNKQTGALEVLTLGNDDAPDGLPPVHTDRHIYPDQTAAEEAAKARLTAFNRSTADVRLEMPGRTDLFAERVISVVDLKPGLNGEYLCESVEQTYTQAGWSTTVECNGGRKGKAKAEAKRERVVLEL